MSVSPRHRLLAATAGIVLAAGTVAVVVHARGGASYELRFATAFSDGEGAAIVAVAVLAAALLASVRWAAALLACFGVLVVVLGVVHPCRVAFEDTPHFDGCSVSASASALGLYLPASALVCAVAAWLAARVAPTAAATAARLLGVSGAVLLGALWLPWYGASDDGSDYTDTGWQVFQRFDVYLAVAAVLAIVLAAAVLRGRARGVGLLARGVALLALSGAGVLFYRLFTAADPPSSGYEPLAAAFAGLGALVAIALAALSTALKGRSFRP
jgi:hypothetical protein